MWRDDNKRLADYFCSGMTENQLEEECAELIQALCKLRRYQNNDKSLKGNSRTFRENVIEEMVDVYVCLDRMIYLYDCWDDIDSFAEKKVARTFERIRSAQQVTGKLKNA